MKLGFGTFFNRIWKDIRSYGLAVTLYVIYHEVTVNTLGASCPSLLFWGIPCPGCGMTRAIWCVLTFRWEDAYKLHPLSFLWVGFLLLFFIYRYIVGRKPRWINIVFFSLLSISILFFVIQMIRFFPNRIPYVYRERNLISNMIPTYGKTIHQLFFH